MEEVNYFVREFEETRGDLDLQATRNLLKQMEAAGALLQEATDICAANLDGACEAVRHAYLHLISMHAVSCKLLEREVVEHCLNAGSFLWLA